MARVAKVRQDTQVQLAAFDEDTTLGQASPEPGYDPFDEDDRIAQRSDVPFEDDPFEEPESDVLPDPDADIEMPEPDGDLEAIEEALDAELQRRQSQEELFEQEPESPIGEQARELLDDLEDGEDDDLLQQLEQERYRAPDLDLQLDPLDQELTPEEIERRRQRLEIERLESEENCHEELQELQADRISSIDLSIRVEGNAGEDYPFECIVSGQTHQPRQWPQITYNWKAAAICHKPLYFEQVQLERYGHSWGPYVQPIMSGVHFFGTLPVLPYKMGIRTPTECVYTLGYYRPGSCAPYMIDPVPFTWRAAMFEGGVATGLSFLIP